MLIDRPGAPLSWKTTEQTFAAESLAVNPCPTDAALALLGHDSLPGDGLDALERHVDECPACQEKLDQLVKNDAGSARGFGRLHRPPTMHRQYLAL